GGGEGETGHHVLGGGREVRAVARWDGGRRVGRLGYEVGRRVEGTDGDLPADHEDRQEGGGRQDGWKGTPERSTRRSWAMHAWNLSLSLWSRLRGRGRSTSRTSRTRPGRPLSTTTRSARKTASSIEWVTSTAACSPGSIWKTRRSSRFISSRVISSRALNGSSRNMTVGRSMSA